MTKSPDPTKDSQFQGVIKHFLKTPPKPFTPGAKKKLSPTPKPARNAAKHTDSARKG
jgi:hypothetical protein